jgi:hypothetical protein
MGNERLDLFLLKEVKQGYQVLPKELWSQPLEPLDRVWDHPLAPWQKAACCAVEPENADSAKAMTTAWQLRGVRSCAATGVQKFLHGLWILSYMTGIMMGRRPS